MNFVHTEKEQKAVVEIEINKLEQSVIITKELQVTALQCYL